MRVAIRRVGVDARRLDGELDRGVLGPGLVEVMAPSKSVNRPRTFEMRWRTWKAASEWALSIENVRVAVAVVMSLSGKDVLTINVLTPI